LTTIDTGTRIARFVLQEFLGRMDRRFEKSDWMLGTVITSLITVCSWGYFIFTGSIATIWPMFGIANQLLAVIALGTGALMIRKWGRGSLSWVAWVPMGFVLMTTTTGAWQLARDVFLRWIDSTDPSLVIRGAVDLALTTTLFTCLGVIGFRSLRAISLKR
ncbi:MAG: carbon starvation protein A, partial [Proteobacteria bacterium]|nr:carbon starvation protein A [Pseudomonadota bacterium]